MQSMKSGDPYGAAHLIERQMRLQDVRQKLALQSPTEEAAPPLRFVTISRDVGSLGDAVAKELARRLGWHVYDREIVDYIARDSHTRQSLVQQLDEKSVNLIEDAVERLLGMVEGTSLGVEEYHAALIRTVMSLGTRGRAVLMGRGANFILRSQPGLHVRILASSETRIQRLSERWLVTPSEARLRMGQTDEDRRNFIRRHFRQDLNDAHSYDLVFNTDHVTAENVVVSILAAMGFTLEGVHPR